MTDRLFRRPADAGEHRQHRVNLRLASSEHAAVRQAAARTRETVTGYAARIVVMAAAGHLDAGADPAEVRELIYWLVQIRNELNQARLLLDEAAATAQTTSERERLADAVKTYDTARQRAEQASRAVLNHLERWRRRLVRRQRQHHR